MNGPTCRHLLGTCFLIASTCSALQSPTTSNHTHQAAPQLDNRITARVPKALMVLRGISFLVVPVSLSAAVASTLALYFDNRRPHPTTCRPPALDKWQHCYVGCMIATWCPSGSFSASILALLKEVRDTMDYGDFSWPDVFATLRGAWLCAECTSCETCCCDMLTNS